MAARTYSVNGMSCDHCAGAVRDEVGGLGGVTGVDVDLVRGQVTVVSELPLDDDAVRAAVEEAGYQLVS
jgi:copper chaperone